MQSLTLFTDGGARGNPGPAGIGVFVQNQAGAVVYELGRAVGDLTNNDAEYLAFLASLEWVLAYPGLTGLEKIEWKLDSMLVVNQLNRKWKIKEPRLRGYATTAWELLVKVPCSFSISHVFREQNQEADRLVNAALDAQLS